MVRSTLLGFVRKSDNGEVLKLSVSTDAFNKAERYTTKNGEEFVQMVINLSSAQKIINGDKEVGSVSQISD